MNSIKSPSNSTMCSVNSLQFSKLSQDKATITSVNFKQTFHRLYRRFPLLALMYVLTCIGYHFNSSILLATPDKKGYYRKRPRECAS